MADRRLSRPDAIRAWPPGRLCQSLARELASFRKITVRRVRVTFRNAKLASFGKIRSRPEKTPDPLYLNSCAKKFFNPSTNALLSREMGDLRSILAKSVILLTEISGPGFGPEIRGNPPESDNSLTHLMIPYGSALPSFPRSHGNRPFCSDCELPVAFRVSVEIRRCRVRREVSKKKS